MLTETRSYKRSYSFVRPSNTTPYAQDDAVNNNATAGGGSTTPLSWFVNAGTAAIRRVKVNKTDQTVATPTVRVWFYDAAVTPAAGDNEAFVHPVANLIDYVDVDVTVAGSDDAVGWTECNIPLGGIDLIYGELQTKTAFTPATGETFTVTIWLGTLGSIGGSSTATIDSSALTDIADNTDGIETLIGSTNTKLDTLLGYNDGVEGLLTTISGGIITTVAADAAVSSINPLGVGARGSTAVPTAMSADGDMTWLWTTLNGAMNSQIVGTSGAAIPGTAADGLLVSATGNGTTVTVTLSLDTVQYANGDILADTQAVAGASRKSGSVIRLDSVTVLDEDNTGFGLDLLFLNANTSLGTENAAPSLLDSAARAIIGSVTVVPSDWIALTNSKVACPSFTPRLMQTSGGTTLYMAALSRGAGTYTASGVQVILGFTWF